MDTKRLVEVILCVQKEFPNVKYTIAQDGPNDTSVLVISMNEQNADIAVPAQPEPQPTYVEPEQQHTQQPYQPVYVPPPQPMMHHPLYRMLIEREFHMMNDPNLKEIFDIMNRYYYGYQPMGNEYAPYAPVPYAPAPVQYAPAPVQYAPAPYAPTTPIATIQVDAHTDAVESTAEPEPTVEPTAAPEPTTEPAVESPVVPTVEPTPEKAIKGPRWSSMVSTSAGAVKGTSVVKLSAEDAIRARPKPRRNNVQPDESANGPFVCPEGHVTGEKIQSRPSRKSIPICYTNHTAEEINPETTIATWRQCTDYCGNPVEGATGLYKNEAAHASNMQKSRGIVPTTSNFCTRHDKNGKPIADVQKCDDPKCTFNHVLNFNPDRDQRRSFRPVKSEHTRNGREYSKSANRTVYNSGENVVRMPPRTLKDHFKIVDASDLKKSNDNSNNKE